MKPPSLELALILGLLAVPAVSAADPVVKMPSSKAIPRRPLEDPHYVWVAYEGYRPLQSPDAKAVPSGAEPLAYMQMCPCLYLEQAGPSEYFLVAKGDSEKGYRPLGWVDGRYCVRRPAALEAATRLHRKAMIVNTVEALKQEERIIKVPMRRAPVESAPSSDSFRLFNVYFLYGDSEPRNPKYGYYLLGRTPGFDYTAAASDRDAPPNVVLGWVAKNRVCNWDTREALEWDVASTMPNAAKRRVTRGKVYASRADAIKAFDGKTVDPLYQEPAFDARGVARPLKYDRMRFPIVDIKGTAEELHTAKGGELRKVGFVGPFVNQRGQEIATAEEIDEIRRELRRIEKEVRTTELLFVIDDTSSMERYCKAVADTVEEIVKSVRGERDRKVRVAITYYRDVDNWRTATPKELDAGLTKIGRLVDVDAAQARELIASLRSPERGQGGGDARELVFHGLKRGIEEAGFSDYARKIVVLVGDMGDHDTNADGKDIAEAEVVKHLIRIRKDTHNRLRLDASPIEFYAIQVLDPDKSSDDAKAFRTQAQTIKRLFEQELAKVGLNKVKTGLYLATTGTEKERAEQVTKHILARYQAMRKQSRELEQQVQALEEGQPGVEVGPELERILQDALRNPEKFERVRHSKGIQVFHYGYVWENAAAGIRQTRVKYLVSAGELQRLLDVLKVLDHPDLTRRPSRQTFARILVGSASGDGDAGLTFESARLKAEGLQARSPLLLRSFGELKYNLETVQELQQIKKKRLILEAALKDLCYDFEEEKKTLESGETLLVWKKKEGASRECPRSFPLYGDLSALWYWIDYDEEWP